MASQRVETTSSSHNTSDSPSTPPRSRSPSQSSQHADAVAPSAHSPRSDLSLDLSDLPSLAEPAPPSNLLLVTNLQDPHIFSSTTLAHLQDLITHNSPSGLYSFSPLPSFRRIVLLFPDTESALHIRQLLDGETLFGNRVKCFFGADTPIEALEEKKHLQAPRAEKQFFISPPPSPPAGWEMREEEPPNKEVHATDLTSALQRLEWRADPEASAKNGEGVEETPAQGVKRAATGSSIGSGRDDGRLRSGSTTMVYVPSDHGSSPDLPAIAVVDTTGDVEADEADVEVSPIEAMPQGGGRIIAHTARPPVETMGDA